MGTGNLNPHITGLQARVNSLAICYCDTQLVKVNDLLWFIWHLLILRFLRLILSNPYFIFTLIRVIQHEVKMSELKDFHSQIVFNPVHYTKFEH
jgi:hypothetical protein